VFAFKLFDVIGIEQETIQSHPPGLNLIVKCNLFLFDIFGQLCQLTSFRHLFIIFGIHAFGFIFNRSFNIADSELNIVSLIFNHFQFGFPLLQFL
jgi:hypothetical protein